MAKISNKMMNILQQLNHKSAVAGWVDDNGSADAAYHDMLLFKLTGEKSPSLTEPASLALIARTLNYGRLEGTTLTGKHYPEIPPRNFMKVAQELFDQKKKAFLAKYIPLVLRGTLPVETFYKLLGDQLQKAITKAIREGDYKPISDATLANRRVSKNPRPLIDSGTLVNSVSFEVRDR